MHNKRERKNKDFFDKKFGGKVFYSYILFGQANRLGEKPARGILPVIAGDVFRRGKDHSKVWFIQAGRRKPSFFYALCEHYFPATIQQF
jgi:hypothetical protein